MTSDGVPDFGNEIAKEQLRETLDGIAAKCRKDGSPLLNALVRDPDGSIDLDDFRRWYLIRYDIELPSSDVPFGDQTVQSVAEAETQRVYDWQWEREQDGRG